MPEVRICAAPRIKVLLRHGTHALDMRDGIAGLTNEMQLLPVARIKLAQEALQLAIVFRRDRLEAVQDVVQERAQIGIDVLVDGRDSFNFG